VSEVILAETYLSTNFLERFGQTINTNINSYPGLISKLMH